MRLGEDMGRRLRGLRRAKVMHCVVWEVRDHPRSASKAKFPTVLGTTLDIVAPRIRHLHVESDVLRNHPCEPWCMVRVEKEGETDTQPRWFAMKPAWSGPKRSPK